MITLNPSEDRMAITRSSMKLLVSNRYESDFQLVLLNFLHKNIYFLSYHIVVLLQNCPTADIIKNVSMTDVKNKYIYDFHLSMCF